MSGYATITFISDLGTADDSVGTVHSILRQLAPGAVVIDLCHEIEPSDELAAALMLARGIEHLAPGVVLASVGRRLERAAIAVSLGAGQSMLVGPDNGVLAAAAAAAGGADAAVRLDAPTSPDHGEAALHPARDVLAPAAGRLAAGTPLADLGCAIDPTLLVPSLIAMPRVDDDGSVRAQVLSVTRWGTVQLNVDRAAIAHLGDLLVAEWSGCAGGSAAIEPASRTVRVAPPGAPGADSLALSDDPYGLLEFSVADQGAVHLGFAVGTEVRLREAA